MHANAQPRPRGIRRQVTLAARSQAINLWPMERGAWSVERGARSTQQKAHARSSIQLQLALALAQRGAGSGVGWSGLALVAWRSR